MVETLRELKDGINVICRENGIHGGMMQDISLLRLKKGGAQTFFDARKETAVLLLTGKAVIAWPNGSSKIERRSIFDENPWCLHVPKGTKVELCVLEPSEFIVQLTTNSRNFAAKLYTPGDCRSDVFGEGEWDGTARRIVRTVFDYNNAPYSNMVNGEVITYPGKWSSYPPHYHPQPEVYVYKFDKPQGFGLCLNGKTAYRVTDNSAAFIEGGTVHPQTSAPGYKMYYCWMIRHLDGNPWKDRIVAKEHEWLLNG